MSETWQNPPGGLEPGFSADPKKSPRLRASDSDRSYAQLLLRTARGEGRLTDIELADRVGQADDAQTLGDLELLLVDVTVPMPARPLSSRLPVPAMPADLPIKAAKAGRHGLDVAIRILGALWITLSVFFVIIWLVTGVGYFWPIWPIMGMAVPIAVLFSIRSAIKPPHTLPPSTPNPNQDLR